MSWLVFALCGPILWAISVHLDKYLVERYFKPSILEPTGIVLGPKGRITLAVEGEASGG